MIKKIFLIIKLTLATFFVSAQQNATLLYNWQDTSLVGSWAYDNVYNECWGLYVNNREIAIIGSTRNTLQFASYC